MHTPMFCTNIHNITTHQAMFSTTPSSHSLLCYLGSPGETLHSWQTDERLHSYFPVSTMLTRYSDRQQTLYKGYSRPPCHRACCVPCPPLFCVWRWSCPWCCGFPPSHFLSRWTKRWRTGWPSSSYSDALLWASAEDLTWRERGLAPLFSPKTS